MDHQFVEPAHITSPIFTTNITNFTNTPNANTNNNNNINNNNNASGENIIQTIPPALEKIKLRYTREHAFEMVTRNVASPIGCRNTNIGK